MKLRHRIQAFLGAARLVRSPWRFVVRELLFYPLRPLARLTALLMGRSYAEAWAGLGDRLGNVARYRLRGADWEVVIRHGTPDVFTLYEILGRRDYALPPHVEAALARCAEPLGVADLGANVGMFGAFVFGCFPGAQLVSFEPDPSNLKVLEQCVDGNTGASWRVVPACASARDGTTPFLAGRFAESRVPPAGRTSGAFEAEMRDVFPYLASVDLLKMDIEGGEWAILSDPRLRNVPVRAIVLEYHRWLCPEGEPGQLAVDLLRRAGFAVGTAREEQPGFGTVWAWKDP